MDHQWEPRTIGRDVPAYVAVAEEIRSAIVRGDLNRGDRLPTEAEMAAKFNVSRGTLREALRTLASMNLIKTTRGVQGGSFVTIPSPEQLIQHIGASLQLIAADLAFPLETTLETRRMLEVPAVRLAVERASDAELQEIADSVHRPARLVTPSQAFHIRIVRATHNPLLETMLYGIFEVHNLRLAMHRSTLDPEGQRLVVEEHQVLAEALLRRDADEAERLMEEHFGSVERIFIEAETPDDQRA